MEGLTLKAALGLSLWAFGEGSEGSEGLMEATSKNI